MSRLRNIWPCIGLAGWALRMRFDRRYREQWTKDAEESLRKLSEYDDWTGMRAAKRVGEREGRTN